MFFAPSSLESFFRKEKRKQGRRQLQLLEYSEEQHHVRVCAPSSFPSLAPSFPGNHGPWCKYTEISMTSFAAIQARSTKKQQSLVGAPFADPQWPPHYPAQPLSSAPPWLLRDCNNSSLCQQGIFLNVFLPAGRQKPPVFFPGRFLFYYYCYFSSR